jgi:hypothetical protein
MVAGRKSQRAAHMRTPDSLGSPRHRDRLPGSLTEGGRGAKTSACRSTRRAAEGWVSVACALCVCVAEWSDPPAVASESFPELFRCCCWLRLGAQNRIWNLLRGASFHFSLWGFRYN